VSSVDATPPHGRLLDCFRSTALVLAAFAGGLILLYQVLEHGPVGVWRWVDIGCGALACVALLASRRAPVVVAALLAVVAGFVASAGVSNMVALYFVARHRSFVVALLLAAADILSGWVFWTVYSGNDSLSLTIMVNTAIAAAVVGWGAMLQSQRALVDVYQERAERAEQEHLFRENHIRVTERTRIAREMHDAVASRISLVALHAGGLSVARRADEDTVKSAELIRLLAIQALDELRVAIGVLRADEPRSLEQPGLDRLPDLLKDAREAGQHVDMTQDTSVDLMPGTRVGRDVYRIVQEGLTNARKHAPGQSVTIGLNQFHGNVDITMRNARGHRTLGMPQSGSGLIGLRERAMLAGGSISHTVLPNGDFELKARLPCP
jgi:signal transduction histidine kinase